MKIFKAQVANFFGHGKDITEFENGGWVRNVLNIKLAKYKVKIIQQSEILKNNLSKKGFIYTTDIEVSNVKSFKEGKNVVNDITRLLSLASISQVVPFSYRFGRKVKE